MRITVQSLRIVNLLISRRSPSPLHLMGGYFSDKEGVVVRFYEGVLGMEIYMCINNYKPKFRIDWITGMGKRVRFLMSMKNKTFLIKIGALYVGRYS